MDDQDSTQVRKEQEVLPDFDQRIDHWTVNTHNFEPGEFLAKISDNSEVNAQEKAVLGMVDEVRLYGSGTFTLSQPLCDDPYAEEI